MIAAARDAGDLVVLNASAKAGDAAYAAANEAIVSEARSLAGPDARLIAVLVWEGAALPGGRCDRRVPALGRHGGLLRPNGDSTV